MSRNVNTVETRSAASSLATTICPAQQGRQEQAHRLSLAFLSDAPRRKNWADQQIEGQHVSDVISRLLRPEEEQDGHHRNRQEHAYLDHDPQHQGPLAEDLAAQLLVEDRVRTVGHQLGALGRREKLVGKQVAVNHDADRIFHFLFFVDDVFTLAADIRRMQEPTIDQDSQNSPGGQAPRGRIASDTKSRATVLSVRVKATHITASGKIVR